MEKSVKDRAIEWLFSEDTGSSSLAICAHMLGVTQPEYSSYPSDPSDLGRCLRLLELIPEWKPMIGEMAAYSPGWAGLSIKWSDLAICMHDEVGIDWSKGRNAGKTYLAMKLAIAEGYRKDVRYVCRFREDGTLASASRKDED